MEHKRDFRWLRVAGALLLGILLLMALLPSTGMTAGLMPHPEMWRFGPFLFFPTSLFLVVGCITGFTSCTVFGIVRRNACEFIGWVLLSLVIVCMFFA
jgi:hypothetical protein